MTYSDLGVEDVKKNVFKKGFLLFSAGCPTPRERLVQVLVGACRSEKVGLVRKIKTQGHITFCSLLPPSFSGAAKRPKKRGPGDGAQ